mgnify:FL=1
MTQPILFAELAPLLDDKLQTSLARVAREHREILLARFAHYGLVVDVGDPAAVKAGEDEIWRIRDARKLDVAQGWTWIRGRRERTEDVTAGRPVGASNTSERTSDVVPVDLSGDAYEAPETRAETLARMREVDDVF